jgi:hypothetical protein
LEGKAVMINNISKSDKITYIILFLIAFIVVFSSTYNTIGFRRMHVDSSVYVTIAQGITRGYLPYMDFVDNKGPLAYLISVPGLYLGGFAGIWITELILMCVSVFFAYKTALFFGDRFKALLGTFFSFMVLTLFFFVNAGTEEYSLPFLMISFYIFTKYFFSQEQDVRFVELIILGVCFSCAILIRLNMFPLWAGFCIVIIIDSVKKRRFPLIGKYISGFCLGIIIAFLPVFFYLKSNEIFNAFIVQAVLGSASKGFSGGGIKDIIKNFYIIINKNFSSIPLFLGLFWVITKYKQSHYIFYFSYTVSYFLMVLFLAFSGNSTHYNMVLVPFFIPALTFFVNLVHSAFSGIKAKNAVLVFFFCCIFSERIIIYLDDLIENLNDESGIQLIKAGKMIDENTRPGDKIISLGFNGYIYPFTKRDAVSKYIYQGSGLDYISGAKKEFISDVLTNKPAIIAIFNAEDGIGQIMDEWHTPVFEMIEKEYRLLSDENGYNLFIRNN